MSGARVTVIGGVQVDVVIVPVSELPPPGHTMLVDELSFRAGGAGANAALAFAEVGIPVRLFGCVGGDQLGRWLADELAPFALGADLTVLSTGTTGLTVACEGPGRDRTFLTYLGVNTQWDTSMISDDAAEADWLLLCDYFCLPALRGQPVLNLLDRARTRGSRTCFDTAWAAQGWSRDTRREVLELLPAVDVFLPNEAELRALSGADGPLEDAARELQRLSGGWVVVKLGGDGCLAVGPGGERLRVPGERIAVVDSTGAGDAFNAGLIAALAEGRPMDAALRAANSLAARIISRSPGDRRAAAGVRPGPATSPLPRAS
jgi:sugar/nucleoside kinase (ribokinase family)